MQNCETGTRPAAYIFFCNQKHVNVARNSQGLAYVVKSE